MARPQVGILFAHSRLHGDTPHVLRVNLITVCFFVGVAAVEAAPVASLLSAACAAWMVRRLNKSERKNETAEKGGTL